LHYLERPPILRDHDVTSKWTANYELAIAAEANSPYASSAYLLILAIAGFRIPGQSKTLPRIKERRLGCARFKIRKDFEGREHHQEHSPCCGMLRFLHPSPSYHSRPSRSLKMQAVLRIGAPVAMTPESFAPELIAAQGVARFSIALPAKKTS
jgi:hypothetical protein